MTKLMEFIRELKARKIFFVLSAPTDAVMVEIHVPGERWEVEFYEDGEVAVEIYVSPGGMFDEGKFQELFDRFSD